MKRTTQTLLNALLALATTALVATTAQANSTLIVEDLVTITVSNTAKSDKKGASKPSSKPSVDKSKAAMTKKGSAGGGTTTQQVPLAIISSTYEAAASSSGGRPSQTTAQAYVITRAMDEHSSVIEDAADRGRAFNAAVIGSGSGSIRLDNVYLSNYSVSISGGQSTESFKVHFQSQDVN